MKVDCDHRAREVQQGNSRTRARSKRIAVIEPADVGTSSPLVAVIVRGKSRKVGHLATRCESDLSRNYKYPAAKSSITTAIVTWFITHNLRFNLLEVRAFHLQGLGVSTLRIAKLQGDRVSLQSPWQLLRRVRSRNRRMSPSSIAGPADHTPVDDVQHERSRRGIAHQCRRRHGRQRLHAGFTVVAFHQVPDRAKEAAANDTAVGDRAAAARYANAIEPKKLYIAVPRAWIRNNGSAHQATRKAIKTRIAESN